MDLAKLLITRTFLALTLTTFFSSPTLAKTLEQEGRWASMLLALLSAKASYDLEHITRGVDQEAFQELMAQYFPGSKNERYWRSFPRLSGNQTIRFLNLKRDGTTVTFDLEVGRSVKIDTRQLESGLLIVNDREVRWDSNDLETSLKKIEFVLGPKQALRFPVLIESAFAFDFVSTVLVLSLVGVAGVATLDAVVMAEPTTAFMRKRRQELLRRFGSSEMVLKRITEFAKNMANVCHYEFRMKKPPVDYKSSQTVKLVEKMMNANMLFEAGWNHVPSLACRKEISIAAGYPEERDFLATLGIKPSALKPACEFLGRFASCATDYKSSTDHSTAPTHGEGEGAASH